MVMNYCPKCGAAAQGNYCCVCGTKLKSTERALRAQYLAARRRVRCYAWERYGEGSFPLGEWCYDAALTALRGPRAPKNSAGRLCQVQTYIDDDHRYTVAQEQERIERAETLAYQLVDACATTVTGVVQFVTG